VGAKMKKSQRGFSAVEALLIVIIIGMLGGVGWYVWHSQKQVDKTYSQTANSSVSPKTKAKSTKTTATPLDPVIYQDNEGKLYQISLLASTDNQKQLGAAIDSYCKTNDKANMSSVGATGVVDLFTNSTNATITSTSASINMSCYDKNAKAVPWGSSARYVFVKDGSTWKFSSVGQGQ
jgi:hypothetical protein